MALRVLAKQSPIYIFTIWRTDYVTRRLERILKTTPPLLNFAGEFKYCPEKNVVRVFFRELCWHGSGTHFLLLTEDGHHSKGKKLSPDSRFFMWGDNCTDQAEFFIFFATKYMDWLSGLPGRGRRRTAPVEREILKTSRRPVVMWRAFECWLGLFFESPCRYLKDLGPHYCICPIA